MALGRMGVRKPHRQRNILQLSPSAPLHPRGKVHTALCEYQLLVYDVVVSVEELNLEIELNNRWDAYQDFPFVERGSNSVTNFIIIARGRKVQD